jgi:hypothetical protein
MPTFSLILLADVPTFMLMKRDQFLSRLRRHCRKNDLALTVDQSRGKGSHITVTVTSPAGGARRTIVKRTIVKRTIVKRTIVKSGELKPGYIALLLKQLALPPGAV